MKNLILHVDAQVLKVYRIVTKMTEDEGITEVERITAENTQQSLLDCNGQWGTTEAQRENCTVCTALE